MYQNQPPLQGMANEMAGYGRYGDSMLVHMNPMEVQGIAALSPTGELTTNPVTGQPEAFLPFLAPLLGSVLGTSLLPTVIPALAGKTALAGAIGSGLATTAATGDIKKGLLSGITGFGLGKALGSAAEAAQGVPELATQAAEATKLADAAKAAQIAADPTVTAEALKGLPAVQEAAAATQKLTAAKGAVTDMSGMDILKAPFQQPGAFGKALVQPGTLAAIGVGEGQRAALTAQEQFEEDAKRFEKEQEEEKERALRNIDAAYTQLGRDYPGYNLPRYAASGGVTSINPQHYADSVAGLQALAGAPIQMFRGGQTARGGQTVTDEVRDAASRAVGSFTGTAPGSPGAATRQAMIRGSEVISPQELQGYRPGFSPEIQYFRRPTQDADPTPAPAPGPGFPTDYTPPTYPGIDLGLGGFDINEYLETEAGQETVGSLRDVLGIPDLSGINERIDAIQNRPQPEIDYDQITSRVREGIDIPRFDTSALEERIAGLEGRGAPEVDLSGIESRLSGLEGRDFPSFDDTALRDRLTELENRELPSVDLSGIESRLSGLESAPGFDASAIQAQIDANRQALGNIPTFDDTALRGRLEALETAPGFDASALQAQIDANRQRFGEIPQVDLSGIESRLSGLEGDPGFDPSGLQSRISALETAPGFDASNLQSRLTALETAPGFDPSALAQRLSDLESAPGFDASGLQQQITALQNRPGFDPSALESQIQANRQAVRDIPRFDDSALRSRLEALESAPGFDPSGLEALVSANTQAISNIPILTPDQLADIQSRGVVTPQVNPLEAMQNKLGATPARSPMPSKTPPKKAPPPKRGRRPGFAEGGDTMIEETAMTDTMESNGQLLIDRAVMAISGRLPEDQAEAVVAAFIDEFGPEAYQMLREKVLEEIVPGSQKEGEIRGPGGGMDDMIPGMIGDSQPVAVSPGEYIVPADVVSGLGDGSTDAGVDELDRMLDRVRQERTGTTRQPAPMSVGGALPA